MGGPVFAPIQGMDLLRFKALKSVSKLPMSLFVIGLSVAGILLLQALIAPLLMLGTVVALSLLTAGLRREFKTRLQEQRHHSELRLDKKISEISLQVAQDIRGPLNALNTLSHLSHEMTADKKELLQVAVARVNGIIEDLLKGKKNPVNSTPTGNIASQKNKIDVIAETDLMAAVEPLLKEYKFSHPQAQWTLHNHLSSSRARVELDIVKMQRILSHLLNNALAAAPETEATIEVTLLERPEHYIVQIMDNGGGSKEAGQGHGFLDAKKIMEALGGELEIRSREGVGTQVILLFPKVFKSEEAQVI